MPILMMLNRAVRRVPLDWHHPTRARGDYRPLLDGSYVEAAAEWDKEAAAWAAGAHPDRKGRDYPYEDWAGARPAEADYMPEFPPDEVLGICMYEAVSEGTPISPVFPDSDEGRARMANYLAANPRGIEDGMTAADWRAIIDGGQGALDIHTGQIEVR